MSKYLDSNGLLYLWGKIKALINTKVTSVEGKSLSTNDYTDTDKAKLTGIAANANNYTHPTESGSKHVPSGGSSGDVLRWASDGTAVWGADQGTSYSEATTSTAGLMSANDKEKLNGIAAGANNYEHPSYTTKSSGLYKITVDATGHVSAATAAAKSDITALDIPGQDTTYSDMSGADGTSAGVHGLVPAPAADKNNCFLRGDGTWATPTETQYNDATTSTHGLMSTTDKTKLDAFGAASTYALKSDITNMYRYKGSVAAVANLPASENTAGDVYNVESSGMNYAWNGTAWDPLGEIFNVENISNAEIDTIVAD